MLRSITALTNSRYLKAVVVLLLSTTWCAAKSQITRIEVFRDGAMLLHIANPAAGELDIWSGPGNKVSRDESPGVSTGGGDIADWDGGAVQAPDDGWPVYKVIFLCEACEPARKDAWRCYGVRYVPGIRGQPGLIQIPDAQDPEFSLNLQTIYRGVEGQWFRASAKWEEIVANSIADAVAGGKPLADSGR
jgi:hypothetical protein